MSSIGAYPGTWAHALVKVSFYTFFAIGITIAIGVSILSTALGYLHNRKQFDRRCNQSTPYYFQKSY